jgi:hypothetical protein
MATSCQDLHGPDTAAKCTELQSLQPVLRLRPLCAGITFKGRVDFISMKKIPLTQGKVALVDNRDFEWLSQWKWYPDKLNTKRCEVQWRVKRPVWKKGCTYMHREIAKRMGIPEKYQIDHRDCNGLNNQRSNLRPSSKGQNAANSRKRSGCTSRFKGVYLHRRPGKWMARVCDIYLGYFDEEEEAGLAYDIAATKLFGDFARLNFP